MDTENTRLQFEGATAPQTRAGNEAIELPPIIGFIERLNDLEQRVDDALAKPQSNEIYKALADAQRNFQPVIRSREVIVKPRESAPYKFSYAPLENILKACLPALNAAGFWFTQEIVRDAQGKLSMMESRLHHQAGSIKNLVPMFVDFAKAQSYNSASTYARRLGAALLFGVASEDDDDGNRGEGNDHTVRDLTPKEEIERLEAKQAARMDEPIQAAKAGYTPGKNVKPKSDAKPEAKPEQKEMHALLEPAQPTEEFDEMAIARKEGLVRDAVSDMKDACFEGRRIGIEQIWGEIKNDDYVTARVWAEMQKSPDLFRTMKEVLKPTDKTARGPKKGE